MYSIFEHTVLYPNKKKTGHLKASASTVCLHLYCAERSLSWGDSKSHITRGKKCSELHSLCPFLDKHEMLPVGGRLKNSSLPYKTQHQVIQPSRHRLTEIE